LSAPARAKAELAHSLAESTFRRALRHEEWGYPETAEDLLDRALAYERDAEKYGREARAQVAS
jgi:hypothetical protein